MKSRISHDTRAIDVQKYPKVQEVQKEMERRIE
jgi:hypothetical protein